MLWQFAMVVSVWGALETANLEGPVKDLQGTWTVIQDPARYDSEFCGLRIRNLTFVGSRIEMTGFHCFGAECSLVTQCSVSERAGRGYGCIDLRSPHGTYRGIFGVKSGRLMLCIPLDPSAQRPSTVLHPNQLAGLMLLRCVHEAPGQTAVRENHPDR